MKSTRQITEAGLFAGILMTFIVGSFYIPLLGTVLYLLAPLPVIILTIRNTVLNVLVSSVVAILLSSMLVSFLVGISTGALALCIGLTIGLSIKKFESTLKAIALGSLGALIALAISLGMSYGINEISMDQIIDDMFSLSSEFQTEIDTRAEVYAATLPIEQQEKIKAAMSESSSNMEMLLDVFKILFPASILLMSAMFSSVNYIAAIQVLKRLKIAHRPLGSFKTFTYPKHLAYGSASMLLGAYVLGRLGIVDMAVVMLNFMYLFLMVFLIQGLSVGYFFLSMRMSKGLSIALLTGLSLFGFLNILSLVGFMDVMMDIRKLQPKAR